MSSPSCFSLSSYRRKGINNTSYSNGDRLGIPEEVCRRFSLAELKRASRNFAPDMKIGRGVLGAIVYKGCIDGVEVAIKRSDPKSYQGLKEFEQEVLVSCQLRHPNLVAFNGLCEEQGEMIIVSEYVPNSSLENHLIGTDDEQRLRLPWKQRLQICIDAARGLHYLHCGAKNAIIHRDVKTSNILLDGNWVAKLCDFGLSRMGPPSMSRSLIRVVSRMRGTLGYVEPEYFHSEEVTEKSDVYSFGVVLFQVLSGRRAFDSSSNHHSLVELVSDCLHKPNTTMDEIIEPCLKGKIAPQCLHKFIEIAASCVFNPRAERPAMGEVEVTLEDALELQETEDSHHQTDYTY